LAKHRKVFTAEEANGLIPRLEIIVLELQMSATRLRGKLRELAQTGHAVEGLTLSQIVGPQPELRAIASKMGELAGRIESFGCLLKDVDQGLIDFPFESRGHLAFLCWQLGEPQVIAWHSLRGGFGQRKPLPGASKPYLN
jgi:hypothetical protein